MARQLAVITLIFAAMCLPVSVNAWRVPPERIGMEWGRCLLVVEGQTRIDGGCYYQMEEGGGFHIDGPRQVFAGIDYPDADVMHLHMSRDYWANIFRDEDDWFGYGNSDIRSTHGEGPTWTDLRRQGACLVNDSVRVCLWAE